MQKIFGTLLIIIVLIFSFQQVCFAKAVTNFSDIVENAKEMDCKTITVRGEAIGQAMKRGRYAWVNIGDKNAALGIWMSVEDMKKIKVYGDYKHEGDIVSVTGQFNRACVEHGGDMDIHADSVDVVEDGKAIIKPVQNNRVTIALSLSVVTVVLAIIYVKGRS